MRTIRHTSARRAITALAALVLAPVAPVKAQGPASPVVRFVTVDSGVRVETIDWGGTGRPVVLLGGRGVTAGNPDLAAFARSLRSSYHVVGMTRRGFPPSSVPRAGYTTDRLADDVLAVIDSLRLHRPVLVGHSRAGAELSSIGSRYPEKVAGLVYLDAGYAYALYDTAVGDYRIDVNEAYRRLSQLLFAPPRDQKTLIAQLLETDLPALTRSLERRQRQLSEARTAPPTPGGAPPADRLPFDLDRAILGGGQRYTHIGAPVLAIFASPHRQPLNMRTDSASVARWVASQAAVAAQATAFERAVPGARVVRLRDADHFVYDSNDEEVLREIRAFVATLPP